MAAAEMNIRDKMSGVSLASDIASLHGHYRTLENRRAEASRILASAEQAVRPALAQMIEGRRQREIVEGCEEKQRARFEKDCQREEVRMLDELALRRFTPASGARVNA
jgi:flagellar export protein FliJ